ncbi:MAG: alpha/beta fold hydrolase [Hyphomicrobiales bacterium]|nr:alpha/beta fold hydrolase [Hyphomicrobiales bacterium]
MTPETAFDYFFGKDSISAVETRPEGQIIGSTLLVHGLGGNKNSETHLAAVERLSEMGVATLRFDFPGHGESSGTTEELTISQGAALVNKLTDELAERFSGKPIALLGASYGGSCILASQVSAKAAAIVLRSPVSDYQAVRAHQLGPDGLARWEKEGVIDGLISRGRLTPWAFYIDAGRIDLYAKAANERAPLLLVHGNKDTTVPVAQSERLCSAWGGKTDLRQIAGGDHSLSDTTHTRMFVDLACSWIADHLGDH